MKLISQSLFTAKKLGLTLVLVGLSFSPAQAFIDLSSVTSGLSSLSQGVSSITSAISIGTSLVSDIAGIFGGGGPATSTTAASAGVPNVPNGDVLPGPGNSSYGISYVRDVFLPNITNWVVSLILAGSVIVIIIGGFMYILGGGNQETTDKGRETVTWGILGAVVAMLAYAIVRLIISINFLG